MVCNLGHITEYLLLRKYSWWVSVLRLYWSAGDFKPGFSQHHNKAWAPLALQPGAGAPTLPSFLLSTFPFFGWCWTIYSNTPWFGHSVWKHTAELPWLWLIGFGSHPAHTVLRISSAPLYGISFLASQFTANHRWNALHKEMQWNYSPQGNFSSL